MASKQHGGSLSSWLRNHTLMTLIDGIIISIAIGYLAGKLSWIGFSFIFTDEDMLIDWVDTLLTWSGYIIWISVAIALFSKGKFEVKPGEGGYIMIFGIPIEFIALTAGMGWVFPWIMSVHIESQQSITFEVKEEFLTQDGMKLSVKLPGLLSVSSPLKFQKINREDAKKYVENMVSGALRAYIAEQKTDVFRLEKPLDGPQASDLIIKLAVFKAEFAKNGVEKIRDAVDEKVIEYGLDTEHLAITEVNLPRNIERTIENYLDECIQRLQLSADATNKAEVVKIFLKSVYQEFMKWDDVPAKQQQDIIENCLTYAYASEGQATIHAFSGSRNKRGPAAVITTT